MDLRGRLTRLEARRPARSGGEITAALAERLARLEEAVLASGDASDRPGAPLIERAVSRYMRGEADPCDALRDLVAGRWP